MARKQHSARLFRKIYALQTDIYDYIVGNLDTQHGPNARRADMKRVKDSLTRGLKLVSNEMRLIVALAESRKNKVCEN